MKKGSAIHTVDIVLFLYIALIWFSASTTIQFRTVAVLEPDFPGNVNRWNLTGEPDNAIITNKDIAIVPFTNSRSRIGKEYQLKRNDNQKRYIAVTAHIVSKTNKNIDTSQTSRDKTEDSLFYAWFSNANHESILINTMHDLVQENKDIHTHHVLSAPSEAAYINIALLLRKFETKHTLLQLKVDLIERTLLYKLIISFLIFVFLTSLFFLLRKYRTRVSPLSFLPVILVVMALTAGVLTPGSSMNIWTTTLTRHISIPEIFEQRNSVFSFQDVLHFTGFFLLTVIVLASRLKLQYSIFRGIYAVTLFAFVTEIIQRHSIDRSSSFDDILIDLAGVISGILVWISVNSFFAKLEASQ